MFASARKGLAFGMKNGQQVLVLGNISVYERDGTYQLYASRILLDGAGLLYEKFEALKAELEEMGMFDPVYKKPIPPFVKKLGVVTAPKTQSGYSDHPLSGTGAGRRCRRKCGKRHCHAGCVWR